MGRVVLVGGARGMAGAIAMTAEAALRSGAGYAVVCTPGSLATSITARVPAAVLALQGGDDRGALSGHDVGRVAEACAQADAIAIGPGLGLAAETSVFLRELLPRLQELDRPTVFDADALNLLATAQLATRSALPSRSILTPHPGEAGRLLGGPVGSPEAERRAALRELVEASGAVVVLKGARTLVGAPGVEVHTNATGNAGMATAGSGDVLTGLIAGLAARGLAPVEAARLGVHLHGVAGDLAAEELGEESLIATDLLRFLPGALRAHPRAEPPASP